MFLILNMSVKKNSYLFAAPAGINCENFVNKFEW